MILRFIGSVKKRMTDVRTNCQTHYTNDPYGRKFVFRDIKTITIEGDDYDMFLKLRKQGKTYGDMLNDVIEKGLRGY